MKACSRKKFGAGNSVIFRHPRHRHHHHRRVHFLAALSLGILQRIVRAIAWVMRKAMRTSGRRDAFRLRQHFHGPDRGAADDSALRPAPGRAAN